MSDLSVVTALLALLEMEVAPPAPADVATAPPAEIGAETDPDEPYAVQAALDADTIVHDSGQVYLRARARLVAHPEVAAEALLDKLSVVPPPGPAQRKRILDVLAELGRSEHVELFANELRRAVSQASSDGKAMEALERWRPLLLDQGASAMPHLEKLVGNRDLPMEARSMLLEDWIEVTPATELGEFVVLVGRGHVTLRKQLLRCVARRVSRDPRARAAVLAAADSAIESLTSGAAEAPRLASLLQFRAAVTGTPDPAFVDRLTALSQDAEAPFTARVASVRGLARFDDDAARGALSRVAEQELQRQDNQASEVLSWLALSGLPAEQAARLAAAHDLVDDDAPRLAALAYRVAPLRHEDWLDRSQASPWPQVRQAALMRVQGPCGRKHVGRLQDIAGARRRGGDEDRQVARAAVQALGRCGPDEARNALERLMNGDEVDVEQRVEAARQLVRHGGRRGIDAVAKALEGDLPRNLARRFAATLRFAPQPTPAAIEALCARLDDGTEVGRAARKSLTILVPDGARCPG